MHVGRTPYIGSFHKDLVPKEEDLTSVELTARGRERSKSENIMCSSSLTRTFSGSRSRQIIPSM